PKVQMRRDPKGGYIRDDEKPESPLAEIGRFKTTGDNADKQAAEKIALLEKAMDRYQKVIQLQQQQLQESNTNRRQLEESLESLKSDLESLRKQLQPTSGKKEAP